MKPGLVILAILFAQHGALAQEASLTLPGVSGASFESGSVVRLPRRARSVVVEVRLPAAQRAARVDLHVGDNRLTTRNFVDGGSLLLVAQTTDPSGFFHLDEQRLETVSMAVTSAKVAEWTILRWKDQTGYLEASKATAGGRAPDVRIDEPRGGAFVFGTRPPSVMVRGSVSTAGDLRLRVGGTEVETVPGDREATFAVEVPVSADLNGIEVFAQNTRTGAIRQLVLPITAVR